MAPAPLMVSSQHFVDSMHLLSFRVAWRAIHTPTLCPRPLLCTLFDVFSQAFNLMFTSLSPACACDVLLYMGDRPLIVSTCLCVTDWNNITPVAGITGECRHFVANGFGLVINLSTYEL